MKGKRPHESERDILERTIKMENPKYSWAMLSTYSIGTLRTLVDEINERKPSNRLLDALKPKHKRVAPVPAVSEQKRGELDWTKEISTLSAREIAIFNEANSLVRVTEQLDRLREEGRILRYYITVPNSEEDQQGIDINIEVSKDKWVGIGVTSLTRVANRKAEMHGRIVVATKTNSGKTRPDRKIFSFLKGRLKKE